MHQSQLLVFPHSSDYTKKSGPQSPSGIPGILRNMHLVAVIGSLSPDSLNRKIAHAAESLARDSMTFHMQEIGNFPLFSTELERDFPFSVTEAKERIASADGVIFFTPEYNRSIPGSLKNFIDWTSRPSGQHPWSQKPVGVVGATPGSLGTATAQYDLKRILTYLGARVMGQPEFFMGSALTKLADDGTLADAKTREALASYLKAFEAHASVR